MKNSEFKLRSASQTGPARSIVVVTPSDTELLPDGPARSLFVGVAGDLAIEDMQGNAVTIASGPSQYHPIQVRRVLATGTTASSIHALY